MILPTIDNTGHANGRLHDNSSGTGIAQLMLGFERVQQFDCTFAMAAPNESFLRAQRPGELSRDARFLVANTEPTPGSCSYHPESRAFECVYCRSKAAGQKLGEKPR